MNIYCNCFGVDLGTTFQSDFMLWYDFQCTNNQTYPRNRINNRNEYKKIKNLHQVKRIYHY